MGLIIDNKTPEYIFIDNKEVSNVKINNDKIWQKFDDYLSFTDVSGEANTLTLTKTSTGTAPTINLEYSTDKVNWTVWTEIENVRSLTIPANGTVYLKGDNTSGFGKDSNNYHTFSSTGNLNAGGDLMSILNKMGIDTIPSCGFINLFSDMTTLKTLPHFTVNSTLSSCCQRMFYRCKGITDASNIHLNVTNVSNYAFYNMFNGCTSLVTPPSFTNESITLSSYSMSAMFRNTALTTGLDLRNVTSIGANAINNMYDGCPNITTVYAPTVTWDTAKSNNWLNNVAASGILIADDSIASTIPTNSTSGCPTGWNVEESHTYLCFTDVSGAANTLSLTKTNTSSTISPDLEYSTDKLNWTTWTETEYVRSVSIPANGRVWLRGNCTGYALAFRFSSTGNVNADGDLMTIINKNGTTTVPNQGLRQLFDSMQTLKKAPAINANTFSTQACLGLFQSCRNLTDVSNIKLINATVSNSAFAEMFKFCSAITVAPEISINNFNNATYVLYGTFRGCTNLNDISNISITATSAPNNTFAQAFQATKITTGLDISSVTTTGTTNVFYQMYDGCSSLTTAYAPTVTWDTAKSTNWLNNVASSGTLYADASISSTIPTDSVDGCPSGWTVQNI